VSEHVPEEMRDSFDRVVALMRGAMEATEELDVRDPVVAGPMMVEIVRSTLQLEMNRRQSQALDITANLTQKMSIFADEAAHPSPDPALKAAEEVLDV